MNTGAASVGILMLILASVTLISILVSYWLLKKYVWQELTPPNDSAGKKEPWA